MQKVKSNASWKNLSLEQQKTLDKWLFDEKMGYAEAWPRARSQLGFQGSESSLRRYYARRRKERTVQEFKQLRDELADISGAPGDVAALRSASMKLLGRFLFQQAKEAPEKVKEWSAVAGLIVQNEHNEVLREAKAEEHRIRREAMAFAKEKFQFDLVEQAMKALPQLKELEQARKDPDAKRYESNAFLNAARYALCRVVWEVRPESAQEEAEMLAARKAREERKQREAEWAKRERLEGHEAPTPSSKYYAEYLEWKKKKEGVND